MRQCIHILTAILLMTLSQVSMSQPGNHIATATQHQTATRNVQARVKIQKPKLFVGNPHKVTVFADDYDDAFLEFDDVITSYRRRDLNKIEHEDGISEQVRWRLFLARQLALLKHKEIHLNGNEIY